MTALELEFNAVKILYSKYIEGFRASIARCEAYQYVENNMGDISQDKIDHIIDTIDNISAEW